MRAIATAELFGSIVKRNAPISGAEIGYQVEIGVTCSMVAATARQLFGGSVAQIEFATEMGLEHHLGMTCDFVCGLWFRFHVQNVNAIVVACALDANLFSSFTDGKHRISFDYVVKVIKQTSHDLPSLYKEISEGGLAKQHFTN